MKKIVAIRVKGTVRLKPDAKRTLELLKLKTKNSFAILTEDKIPMLKKVENYITWGEASDEILEKLKNKESLNNPRGGFKSLKNFYPKGALGYRGEKINELIIKMLGEKNEEEKKKD